MRKEQICDWVRRGDGYAGMGKENPLASGTAVAVSAFVRAAVRGNFLCGQQRGCPAAQKAGEESGGAGSLSGGRVLRILSAA